MHAFAARKALLYRAWTLDVGLWILDFGSWTYFDHSQVQGEKAPIEGRDERTRAMSYSRGLLGVVFCRPMAYFKAL